MNCVIKSVNIIGAGNLGIQLCTHLKQKLKVASIYSSRVSEVQRIVGAEIQVVDDLESLPTADLNIICVKDDAIASVVSKLSKETPTVHTAGAVDMNVLRELSVFGIIYPLQTFSRNRDLNFEAIPVLVEASDPTFLKSLKDFVFTNLSTKVTVVNSEGRKKLHLAAVFVNNFTTQLILEGELILKGEEFGIDLLFPLLEETISKIKAGGAKSALTGPAKRNDQQTMEKHLMQLTDEDINTIYRLISKRIQSAT